MNSEEKLVCSSIFIMDLANSIMFLSLAVYLQLWITEICPSSDACSSLKFELKIFSFDYLVVSNYIVVRATNL